MAFVTSKIKQMDLSSGSDLTKWLENILAKSKAKFSFLANRYPAWTSGPHGRLGKDDRPAGKPARFAHDVLIPLLKKYNATAMFAGHDHIYRKDVVDDIPCFVTGGGGAEIGSGEGSFHHFMYVSVKGEQVNFAVVKTGGVVSEEIVTGQTITTGE